MTKRKENILKIAIICATVAICSLIIVLGAVKSSSAENPNKWIIRSYGNSVALYKDESLSEIFSEVDISALPPSDRKTLQNGIAFSSKEEAKRAIEDYDG